MKSEKVLKIFLQYALYFRLIFSSGRSLLFTVKPTVDDDGVSKQYHSLQLEITIPVEV